MLVTVTATETGELAKEFIDAALAHHGIERDQLALHADRRTSMTSKPVAQLLVDLGVDRSHSRPHLSNDNPYSDYAEGVVMPSADRGARVRAGRSAAVA